MVRHRFAIVLMVLFMIQSAWAVANKIEKGQEAEFISGIHQLTMAGARTGEGYYRLDGQRMVFQSEREEGNPFYQIYLMDLKSGETQRISPGYGKTTCSWVHPTQEKVIYASTHLDKLSLQKQKEELEIRASGKQRRYAWDYDENFDLFVSDFKGKGTKRLTETKGYDAEASYSADGEWIVFASNRSGYLEKLEGEDAKHFAVDPSYEIDLYIMRSNGKDLKRLTSTKGYDGGPFFSADGSKITWRRFSPDGRSAEVFTMDRDGSNVQQLTQFGKISWAPFFHPSGDYLIFSSNLAGGHNFELYLVRADGKGPVVQVTDHEGFDGLAVFSPDGKDLAWTGSRAMEGKAQVFRGQWNDQAARKALGLLDSSSPIPAHQLVSGLDRGGFEAHLRYLSSDKLAGRLTGSAGEKLAGHYIEAVFKNIGLEPLSGLKTFFHPFEFTQKVEMGEGNKLSLQEKGKTTDLTLGKDWSPLAFSTTGSIPSGEVVFVGYGIRAPKTENFGGYDSYLEADVKDKWVMVFRYQPEKLSSIEQQQLSRYSTLRDKAMLARDLGARGLIIVTGPNVKVKNELIQFASNEVSGSMSLPVISISNQVAETLLAGQKQNLKAYQASLDDGKSKSVIDIGVVKWQGQIDLNRVKAQGMNVVARLPGRSSEAVVVGAHYDHLGHGHHMNSLAKTDEQGLIHSGADDNASGVAGVLEIADQLAKDYGQRGRRLQRDVIFTLWSGEELGTLGSNKFIEDFVTSKKLKVHSYVNMDMIGRLNGRLIVQGIGSSPNWESILEHVAAPRSVPLALQMDPYLPTDATPFYLAKVPIINFFTGAHEDYHSPRDRADKIKYDEALQIVELVGGVTLNLASMKESIPYREVAAKRGGGSRKLRIYIGTIPNYADDSGKGLAINGVQKGGPAEKAGIQSGDVVVELAGHKVENIYDYTNALDRMKIGEKAKVLVNRKGQVVQVWLVPETRD